MTIFNLSGADVKIWYYDHVTARIQCARGSLRYLAAKVRADWAMWGKYDCRWLGVRRLWLANHPNAPWRRSFL